MAFYARYGLHCKRVRVQVRKKGTMGTGYWCRVRCGVRCVGTGRVRGRHRWVQCTGTGCGHDRVARYNNLELQEPQLFLIDARCTNISGRFAGNWTFEAFH